MSDTAEVPSFDRPPTDPGRPPEPVRFMCDGEEFHCAPLGFLPAGGTRDLARLARANRNEQVLLFGDFIDSVMLSTDGEPVMKDGEDTGLKVPGTSSAERFARRLRNPSNPVVNDQISQIVAFLIRKYGNRPTTPASPSVNGASAGSAS